MAGFERIDKTDNSVPGRSWSKINRMFAQLFGATYPGVAAGVAAPLSAIQLDTGTKAATATAGAATLNKSSGVVTSEALTTAAGAAYTLTLTDSKIGANDVVLVSVANGTNIQGIPMLGRVTPAAGSVAVEVRNMHASQALNGTLKIAFAVFKA